MTLLVPIPGAARFLSLRFLSLRESSKPELFGFSELEQEQYNQAVAQGVGRFQVMATLQAARARVLGLPLTTAKSWGLNRAIFYAAAKRGFKGTPSPGQPSKRQPAVSEFWLGDDKAYKVSAGANTLFSIGGEIQKPEDFERQIERRFSGTFRNAWGEALAIVQRWDRRVLESQSGFYMHVYRPQRDELAKKWNDRAIEREAE